MTWHRLTQNAARLPPPTASGIAAPADRMGALRLVISLGTLLALVLIGGTQPDLVGAGRGGRTSCPHDARS